MRVFVFLSIFLFTTSCSTITPAKQETGNQKALNAQEKKAEKTLEKLEKNAENKSIQTSILAAGTQYSLSQVTNPPVEVQTAQALNERLISIVGTPHLDELQKIKLIVDLLNSEVSEERKKGEKLLSQRDQIIVLLQKEKVDLKTIYETQVSVLTDKAKEVAKTADENQATINTMSGMFGLNAVFWGLKKFFFNFLTFIVVFGVIFLILRVLSTVNPIAATAFSIFNLLGSVVLNTVKSLTPNAVNLCKLVPQSEHNKYKDTLDKIVDTVEELKRKGELLQKDILLSEVLVELDKSMNQSDKDCVEELLKNQNWK